MMKMEIMILKILYYQYDRGGGMEMRFSEDEICGDSRFFVFLGSKSKFLLA